MSKCKLAGEVTSWISADKTSRSQHIVGFSKVGGHLHCPRLGFFQSASKFFSDFYLRFDEHSCAVVGVAARAIAMKSAVSSLKHKSVCICSAIYSLEQYSQREPTFEVLSENARVIASLIFMRNHQTSVSFSA